MNRRKIREYPPVAAYIIAAAIFYIIAIVAIRRNIDKIEAQGADRPPAETREEVVTVEREIEISYAIPTTEAARDLLIDEPEQEDRYQLTEAEETILLKIAMAEAESETTEGKALVMCVVMNRVAHKQFPDTIEEVVFQPRQFSPVRKGGRYYTTEPNEDCYAALELIQSGWDESKGALFFESNDGDTWHSRNLEYLYTVGGHKFYK